MYSQEELNISNKSYINKDFPALYNELLDIAKKISYKYDPTTSNESDPMIMLIKLIALASDKLDYNVDKNILERFATSITQWNAMQERTSTLGYNMHYYKSSTGKISIKYNGDTSSFSGSDSIIFPAFKTKFTTSSSNVNFILTSTVTLFATDLNAKKWVSGDIIQGELKTFTTLNGDESVVTLNDLDDFNRLYFSEPMVAENGVFIEQDNIGNDDWQLVDNLNNQVPLTRCFIFRYDATRKLPYIQFPDDISSLIDGGLHISYVITNGNEGNISAQSIDKLLTNATTDSEELEEETNLDKYIVINSSELANGVDIEGIDSAYFNFQKTVGTFDTLVACRDYANYIYNLSDDDFNSLVSNVQVCDRRDDYNYSTKVTTFNNYGQSTVIEVEQESDGNGGTQDAVTAFNLMLYTLQPMRGSTVNDYKGSFKPLTDTSAIEYKLESSKCLSHNYKQLKDDDIYAFKAYYKLNAKITTTYKVNSLEQTSIRNNISQALMENFNARKVDYGTEIPYDTILKVIENADSRIKFVSLDEPQIDVKAMTKTNENNFSTNVTEYLGKNVLAGRVSLYDYDEDFKYDFGQMGDSVTSVATLTTCAQITMGTTEKTLKDNEVIQVFTPNLLNGREWSYGWFYKVPTTTGLFTKGVNELSSTKWIEIYDNKEGTGTATVLNTGFVELNFVPQVPDSTHPVWQINSGDSIIEKSLNEVILDDSAYFYWVTNNTVLCRKRDDGTYEISPAPSENIVDCSYIDWDSTTNEYILLDNEYLYMTDSKYQYLYAYGPGTRIKKVGLLSLQKYLPVINIDEVKEKGLVNLQDKFIYVSLDSSNRFELQEQQVLTLTAGDKYKISSGTLALSTTEDSINVNKMVSTDKTISYVINNGSSGTISKIGDYDTYVRARLDVNCDSTHSQTILENQYVYEDGVAIPSLSPYLNILSKYPINIIGGTNRLIKVYNYETQSYMNNLIYAYQNYHSTSQTNIKNLAYKEQAYYKMSINEGSSSNNQDRVTMLIPVDTGKNTLVMIYVNSKEEIEPGTAIDSLSITQKGTNLNFDEASTQLHQGINVIAFDTTLSSEYSIVFQSSSSGTLKKFSGNIVVSEPRILNGKYNDATLTNIAINPQLNIISLTDWTNLYEYIMDNPKYREIFYFNNIINNAYYIDEDDITGAYALFNFNNVVNKITIPEIDIDYAINNITIAKSSQL